MIPFNRAPYTGNEDQFVLAAMRSGRMSGDGAFGAQCQQWFEENLGCSKALLTPSCTHALELAALLIDVGPGDEIIMPSYTFVSTANAFALRGATLVFVDVRPDTMNMDEELVESAVTGMTKAIVPVHYAGVSCEMDTILAIARRHELFVVEDAAQAVMSSYRGRAVGSLGDLSAFSFHETKNITSGGEGGLLAINDPKFVSRAEILREKGTNRSQFFRGMVDKYSWVDIGSSYLLSEIQSAYLWGQLELIDEIVEDRMATWAHYMESFRELERAGHVELPVVPDACTHNGHMFYLKVHDLDQRSQLIDHLRACGVYAVFHYVPLHTARAGMRYGRFNGVDNHTTTGSDRLLRLPVWFGLDERDLDHIIGSVYSFFE